MIISDMYLLNGEFGEVRLLVELVQKLTKKVAVCKVLLKLFYRLHIIQLLTYHSIGDLMSADHCIRF